MNKFDSATPYLASFLLLRRDNEVPFVLRTNTGYMDDHYGLPSGKIDHNESAIQAAIREVREEVGVTVRPEDVKHVLTIHRADTDGTFWVDFYFETSVWEGEPTNVEPDKSQEVRWLDITDLPDNVIPDVRAGLEALSRGETYLELGWDQLKP